MDSFVPRPGEPDMERVTYSGTPPLYVVVLHRLARLGKATMYGGINNRLVQFNLTSPEGEVLTTKWAALANAERVWIVYKRPPDEFDRRPL